ncbi:MAG TPA: OmpA family protein [Leptospiraceae bacterium]|nr:OmpA family protein [Leptospiraceae bacterium]HMW07598.1 OmpA family protein [Leptospiraceae bacterium]HMX33024.1 OmpA family protein [Leptospiraceae bacterium]HMY33187.1 OmpA family protein [Leptospiraceae bacterium]HMZ66356.1 OmpA family protein [Leptospiraceae bacterium]
MNRQFIRTVLVIGIVSTSLAFCSGNDKKNSPDPKDAKTAEDTKTTDRAAVEEPKDVKPVDAKDDKDSVAKRALTGAADELFAQLNESLKSARYPDGESIEGFAYKKWEIPNKKDFVKWVKGAGAVLKKGLDELPAIYTLEIAGHTDTVGPENPEGAKKGNMFYSEQRAKEVKQALVKLGFPEKRIATKAMGSSNPIPGIPGESAKNRRVTFQFLAGEPEAKDSSATDAPKTDAKDESK